VLTHQAFDFIGENLCHLRIMEGKAMAEHQVPDEVAVVTGDFVGSRRYSRAQRQVLDQALTATFNSASELLPDAVYAPLGFSVVQGDEFQLVLQRPDLAYPFVVLMRTLLSTSGLSPRPTFRAAIGIGEMAVSQGRSSYAMDGAAFHFARDGMQRLAKAKGGRPRMTMLLTGDTDRDAWFDLILMYQDLIENRWTPAQLEAVRWRQQLSTYEAIGQKIGIAKQNVQKRLRAACWDEFRRGIDFIRDASVTL
jgi:hypothetical protein